MCIRQGSTDLGKSVIVIIMASSVFSLQSCPPGEQSKCSNLSSTRLPHTPTSTENPAHPVPDLLLEKACARRPGNDISATAVPAVSPGTYCDLLEDEGTAPTLNVASRSQSSNGLSLGSVHRYAYSAYSAVQSKDGRQRRELESVRAAAGFGESAFVAQPSYDWEGEYTANFVKKLNFVLLRPSGILILPLSPPLPVSEYDKVFYFDEAPGDDLAH